MSQHDLESKFLDFLEGRLPENEKTSFQAALDTDPALRQSLEDYSKLVAIESEIAGEAHGVHPSFTAQVMDRLNSPAVYGQQGFFERLSMYLREHRRLITGSVATFATLAVVVRLAWETPIGSFQMRPPNVHEMAEILKSNEVRRAQEAAQVAGNSGPIVAREVDADSGAGADVKKDKAEGVREEKERVSVDLASGIHQPVVPQELPSSLTVRRMGEAPRQDGRDAKMMDPSAALGKTQGEQGALLQALRSKVASVGGGAVDAARRPAPAPGMSESLAFNDMLAQNYAEPSAESYRSVSENKRTLVSDESVSTFSIDVDTASYANIRRFITSGQLPPSDAVRIEELINYFDYSYPVQYEKPFTLSYEIAPSPLEKDRMLVKLGIKARDAQPTEKGWNLVLLVDVSGSMSDPNKLPLLKRSLPVLVEAMRPQDKIALVTYAGNAGVALESTAGNEKFRIKNAIDNLASGGGTNGAGGINMAYEIAEKNRIAGGVNRVILVTDGDFNVGVTSHDELIRLIEQKRKSGITLTTIGMGTGNLRDSMMEQLADKGNGNYFYMDSFKEARKILSTDLVGNMEVVAKDVKLQIEFNPQQVAEYRLVGYDNRRLAKQDFNNDTVDAGEIGTGHTVTALYEIVLANSEAAKHLQDDLRYHTGKEQKKVEVPAEKTGELAFLKIRYKKPEESTSTLLQYPILAADVRSDAGKATDDFRFAAAVGYFGHLLRHSEFAGSYTFADIAKLAQDSKGIDSKGYRQEFIELVKDAQALSGHANPEPTVWAVRD